VFCWSGVLQTLKTDLHRSDIWIDRAVLHFLLTEVDIQGYFDNLKVNLCNGGYALFAEFSLSGPEKCAGLSLNRYSMAELAERLGPGFLIHSLQPNSPVWQNNGPVPSGTGPLLANSSVEQY